MIGTGAGARMGPRPGGDSDPEWRALAEAFLRAEPEAATIARRLFWAGREGRWERATGSVQRLDQLQAALRDLLLAVEWGEHALALARMRLLEQLLLSPC